MNHSSFITHHSSIITQHTETVTQIVQITITQATSIKHAISDLRHLSHLVCQMLHLALRNDVTSDQKVLWVMSQKNIRRRFEVLKHQKSRHLMNSEVKGVNKIIEFEVFNKTIAK